MAWVYINVSQINNIFHFFGDNLKNLVTYIINSAGTMVIVGRDIILSEIYYAINLFVYIISSNMTPYKSF